MVQGHERRQHERANCSFTMTVNINGAYFDVEVVNISVGGALAQIVKGDHELLNDADEGACFFETKGIEFESDIVLVRRINTKMAFRFIGLSQDHIDILEEIVEKNK